LWLALIANTFFWFLGAILLLNVVLYATDVLQVDEAHSSYLLAVLSLGIGVGSFMAGYTSGKKIETGMILPGLTGIVLLSGALSVPGLTYGALMGLLGLLEVCAGFFVVPVNALIQKPSEARSEGASDWSSEPAFVRGHRAAAVGTVDDDAAGTSGSWAGLICAVACLGVLVVLPRMLPELWPSALYWTRLKHRVTL
jgi:hypothetical protein